MFPVISGFVSSMIAFKADTVIKKSLRPEKTLVFINVILNIGDAYNNDNGIFTAPVTGLYLFTAHLCLQQVDWANFGIVVNGTAVSVTGIGDQWWSFNAFDAITLVENGKDVNVQCINDCDKHDKLKTHEYIINSFSGTLFKCFPPIQQSCSRRHLEKS